MNGFASQKVHTHTTILYFCFAWPIELAYLPTEYESFQSQLMNSIDISHLRDTITWTQVFLQKTGVQKNYETATAITVGSDRRERT